MINTQTHAWDIWMRCAFGREEFTMSVWFIQTLPSRFLPFSLDCITESNPWLGGQHRLLLLFLASMLSPISLRYELGDQSCVVVCYPVAWLIVTIQWVLLIDKRWLFLDVGQSWSKDVPASDVVQCDLVNPALGGKGKPPSWLWNSVLLSQRLSAFVFKWLLEGASLWKDEQSRTNASWISVIPRRGHTGPGGVRGSFLQRYPAGGQEVWKAASSSPRWWFSQGKNWTVGANCGFDAEG